MNLWNNVLNFILIPILIIVKYHFNVKFNFICTVNIKFKYLKLLFLNSKRV